MKSQWWSIVTPDTLHPGNFAQGATREQAIANHLAWIDQRNARAGFACLSREILGAYPHAGTP